MNYSHNNAKHINIGANGKLLRKEVMSVYLSNVSPIIPKTRHPFFLYCLLPMISTQ